MGRNKNKDREFEQLKRENARLRKMLNRDYDSYDSDAVKDEFEVNQEKNPRLLKKDLQECPKCKSETSETCLGRFTYRFCSGCNFRKRI